MIKENYFIVLVIVFLTLITGCDSKNNISTNQNNDNSIIIKDNNSNETEEVINSVKLIINEKEYTINLEANETARKFVNILPQELNMHELNGNEKYVYLDATLLANPSNPKIINAGDVMLYGNSCLVIFYKTFNTSYSYTKIGHIEKLPDLGKKDIKVRIEK